MRFKRKSIIAILLIIITLIFTGCSSNKNEPITRKEFLMDTPITLTIYDKKDEVILDKAVDRLKEIENRMSSTIENSDISMINRNAGIKPVEVHEDVYYVIKKARYFADISQGAYDPTIGPLADLWNITGTDEKERDSIPTEEEIEEKKDLVNYNGIGLVKNNMVYLKEKGMKLDLGGIAKGYAADEVKRIFEENEVENAIIDLGGNIYAMGTRNNSKPWRIGIQDPFEVSGDYMGIFNANNRSIVTSGDYERYFKHDGKKYHHIINPKTGYPSENEISGVSIVSNASIDGDALSTALFVLGVDQGMNLIDNLEDIDVIFVTKENKAIIEEKTKDKFELSNDDLELIIK